jgi:uncharacterized membrane protein
MIKPKKKRPGRSPERLLILVTALGLVVYLVIDGTVKNEIDRIYVIGLLVAIIGYFVKDLTDQDDDNGGEP